MAADFLATIPFFGFRSGKMSPRAKAARAQLTKVQRSESRKDSAALKEARALALQYPTISIDVDDQDKKAYWVTCSSFEEGESDPAEGGHFCQGGREALQVVEVYVEALKKVQP